MYTKWFIIHLNEIILSSELCEHELTREMRSEF